ncbi:MAG: pilus assembly protein CpaF [Candidatus Omnitrophota bacterium]|jgi:pilus assembly protein CpaF
MAAKIITVFSSKGGVGKTFATVNLGTVFAVSNKKVLLVDFDVQAGQDMARMINVSPRMSVADICTQENLADDDVFITPSTTAHACGLHFIPAVTNTKQIGLLTTDNIKSFILRAQQEFDYIFIDAGRSFSEPLVTILDSSNLIVLVATPDVLAVYQIKWCLDVLQKLHFPPKMVNLILNRSESRGSVAWQEVRSALTCKILGHIPSEGKAVGTALNRGVPCVIDSPNSRVAESFAKIVNTLNDESIYTQATNMDAVRSMEGMENPSKFWENFGIAQGMGGDINADYSTEEDVIMALKTSIHQKLISRLNIDGVSLDSFNDPERIANVKKASEEIVSNLLMEEAGGNISSHEERLKLVRDIVNEALGLGPLEDFLADADITDIMCNSRNEIYVEKNGKLILTNKKFISDNRMRAIIDRIIAPLGRRIDESTPMVDARLPDGSRINAIIPPLALNGPMITIRKFGQERITVSELLTKYKSMSQDMSDFLRACVMGRKNIILSGGTGAGKTTLLNVVSEFIPDNERIITIEDAAELKLKKSHWGRLETRPKNVEGRGEITIRDLFVNCLRMRPDRVVIGECRGAEVLDMLQAMNTGHDGSMTTLHANSTRDAMTRLQAMILLAGIELPPRAINEMIGSAIDIVVHINRFSDGTRKITGISEVVGLTKEYYLNIEDIFIFDQEGIDSDGKVLGDYKSTGYVPLCFKEFAMRGMKIEKSIFTKDE